MVVVMFRRTRGLSGSYWKLKFRISIRYSFLARREGDGIHDRRDATFGLREGEIAEAPNDAADDLLVGDVRAAVGGLHHRAVPTDDELGHDTAVEGGVVAKTRLVAETELFIGEEGATVYVTGRSVRGASTRPDLPGTTIDDTAKLVTARGGVGIPVQCDHSVESQVKALFDRVRCEHNRLDIVVNNA